MPDIEARMVATFPGNRRRQRLFAGLGRLRSDAERHGVSGTQWINGSFVTNKEYPGDVDLVTFADYDLLNSLSPDAKKFLRDALGADEKAKPRYLCHSFLQATVPEGHPFHSVYAHSLCEYIRLFHSTRNPAGLARPGTPKGVLQTTVGDPALAPALQLGRGAA